MTDELMTPQDIADRLKVPVRSVRERVVKIPSFPAPALNLSQKLRRWARADVEAWLAKKARQNAR